MSLNVRFTPESGHFWKLRKRSAFDPKQTFAECLTASSRYLTISRPDAQIGDNRRDWFEGTVQAHVFHGNIVNYFVAWAISCFSFRPRSRRSSNSWKATRCT